MIGCIKAGFDSAVGFFGGGVAGKIAVIMAGMIVVMGLGLWLIFNHVGGLNVKLGKLEVQRDQAIETAKDNAALVKIVEDIGIHNIAAVGAILDDAKKRSAQVNTILKEVNRVRPEDARPIGCPVVPGPILRALDGVREQRSQDAGQGPANGTQGSHPLAIMRPRAVAAGEGPRNGS